MSEHRIADPVGGTYGSSEAAAGWQRSAVARAQILAPLTDRMLDLAGVDIGHRVLDVAAGTGEQTLLAAQRVGPTGTVLATDIAVRMLALAEEAAARAGLRNVKTRGLGRSRPSPRARIIRRRNRAAGTHAGPRARAGNGRHSSGTEAGQKVCGFGYWQRR